MLVVLQIFLQKFRISQSVRRSAASVPQVAPVHTARNNPKGLVIVDCLDGHELAVEYYIPNII
jgi:hypothetical protein